MSGISKLFGGGAIAKAQKSVSMPDPEDPEIQEKRRRRMLQSQARGGRQSTILSGEAPQYSGTSLGT
jgi:hypothetical protein